MPMTSSSFREDTPSVVGLPSGTCTRGPVRVPWPQAHGTAAARRGVTLIELMALTAVISSLLGLSLTVLSASLERSRSLSCQNNLRQLGLGMLAASIAQRDSFPAAFTSADGFLPVANAPDALAACRRTWVVDILPFIDEVQVHDAFDPAASLFHPRHAEARSVRIPVLLCPSDPHAMTAFDGSRSQRLAGLGRDVSRCTYAANGGLGMASTPGAVDASLEAFAAGAPATPWWLRYPGISGGNCGQRESDITDPKSKTILLAEIRAGTLPIDPRGVWSLPLGSSGVWGHGGRLGIGGPNSAHPLGDDVLNCTELVTTQMSTRPSTDLDAPPVEPPCNPRNAPGWMQMARSMHEGGLSVCMADGSVRWISDFIQVDPSSDGALSVWDRLIVSKDGLVLDNADY